MPRLATARCNRAVGPWLRNLDSTQSPLTLYKDENQASSSTFLFKWKKRHVTRVTITTTTKHDRQIWETEKCSSAELILNCCYFHSHAGGDRQSRAMCLSLFPGVWSADRPGQARLAGWLPRRSSEPARCLAPAVGIWKSSFLF